MAHLFLPPRFYGEDERAAAWTAQTYSSEMKVGNAEFLDS